MAKQLPSSPSNKMISELIGMIRREELILQPEFQRKLVWNINHKSAFIDTILKGYPFPEIYLSQSGIDFETLKSQQVVVDGQQRLSTIMQYVEGVPEQRWKSIPMFKDLSVEQKNDFLNYNVVVRNLQDASEEVVKEVFRRINQTKFNLEQIEIQNALYDGEFISAAKQIVTQNELENFPVFSDIDISRMSDLNFILLCMSTLLVGGYYAGNKQTEEFIIRFNDSFDDREKVISQFNQTIEYIKGLSLSKDSIWFRKSNFFTMVMELLFHPLPQVDISESLKVFETNIIENKDNKDNEYGMYYAYMYTGTNGRTARVERGRLFQKHILNKLEA